MKYIKSIPKPITAIINILFFLLAIILFFGRKKQFFKIDFLSNNLNEFYFHISNFSISYMLAAGIGFMWLLQGVKFKWITLLVISIAVVNLIYELWIPILNTVDIMDAYYGLAGTALAYIFLLLSNKFGFVPNTSF